MVAQVLDYDQEKQRLLISVKGEPKFLWNYEVRKEIEVDPKSIPAISLVNKPEEIFSKNSIAFPDNLDEFYVKPREEDIEEEIEKITLVHSRKEESEKLHTMQVQSEQVQQVAQEDDDEQSIIVQKLRELVIRFEKLLIRYLDPDIPTGRKARRKYHEEMEIFRDRGYKEFIIAIDSKVDALCIFEKIFCKDMFDSGKKGDFKEKIQKALKGDFDTALQVVNAVEQIVTEEEYGVSKRRLVTKIR